MPADPASPLPVLPAVLTLVDGRFIRWFLVSLVTGLGPLGCRRLWCRRLWCRPLGYRPLKYCRGRRLWCPVDQVLKGRMRRDERPIASIVGIGVSIAALRLTGHSSVDR